MLENELSIITGRDWIKLSAEQKKVIDDIEQLEMAGDGDDHDGSIIFMKGPYGSGKTVLGIEVGVSCAARDSRGTLARRWS